MHGSESLLSLPITEPVTFFALMIALILGVPALFERFRLPGLVGLILAGVVFGPHGLGLFERDHSVVLLATVGLLWVMFLAGLEIDLREFKRYRTRSIGFGVASCAAMLGLGFLGGRALGFPLAGCVLIGAVLASQTLLAYPLAARLGLAKRLPVITAVGATIVTDVLALFVLAVVASASVGPLDAGVVVRLVGALAVFAFGTFFLLPKATAWIIRRADMSREQEFLLILALMFLCAAVAKLLEIEAIVGAFFAGLALNRFVPDHSPNANRLMFVGNTLFIPFFLIATGMLVDLTALTSSWEIWRQAAVFLGALLLGKGGLALLLGWRFGFGFSERMTLFGLTFSQAAAALAATLTGYKLGLFPETTVNAVVLVILATCLIGPLSVQIFGRRMASKLPEAVAGDLTAWPKRVLVACRTIPEGHALADWALRLGVREAGATLYPLAVAPQDAEDRAQALHEAELRAQAVAAHVGAEEVEVEPQTRLALRSGAAIARVAEEARADVVLVGWDGTRSLSERAFGNVLDHAIAHCAGLVAVAKLQPAFGAARRIVVFAPPEFTHLPGAPEALALVARLARLGDTALEIWGVADPEDLPPADWERAVGLPLTRRVFSAWREIGPAWTRTAQPDDLAIVLGARPGELAYRPFVERLPAVLAAAPTPMLILYPPLAPGSMLPEALEA